MCYHTIQLTYNTKLLCKTHNVTSSFLILQFNENFFPSPFLTINRLSAFNKVQNEYFFFNFRVLLSPYTVPLWQVVYFPSIENSLNDLAHTILVLIYGVARIWNYRLKHGCAAVHWKLCRAPMSVIYSERGHHTR